MGDDCLGLGPCFAGLDALVPRAGEFCAARCSAVFEPRTAATATTALAGFLHGAAFGAHRIDDRGRRRGS